MIVTLDNRSIMKHPDWVSISNSMGKQPSVKCHVYAVIILVLDLPSLPSLFLSVPPTACNNNNYNDEEYNNTNTSSHSTSNVCELVRLLFSCITIWHCYKIINFSECYTHHAKLGQYISYTELIINRGVGNIKVLVGGGGNACFPRNLKF